MNSGRFQKNNTLGQKTWFSKGHKIWVGRKHKPETIEKLKLARLGKKYPRTNKIKIKPFKLDNFLRVASPQKKKYKHTYNKQNKKEYNREYRKKLKNFIFEFLGGKCSNPNCGFSDYRALQIDHINGGGSIERKERGFSGIYYRHVLRSVLNKEGKYQLLCANCNWIKRFENNEHRK